MRGKGESKKRRGEGEEWVKKGGGEEEEEGRKRGEGE